MVDLMFTEHDRELFSVAILMTELFRELQPIDISTPVKRLKELITGEVNTGGERPKRLPKNVASAIRAVLNRTPQDELIQCALDRKNPFGEFSQPSQFMTFNLLLTLHVTKSELRKQISGQMGWSDSSAASQASILWRSFLELGLATEEGGRLRLISKLS